MLYPKIVQSDMEFEERPAKKRRFFVEDSPEPEFHSQPQGQQHDAAHETNGGHATKSAPDAVDENPGAFDASLFEAFVGEKLSDGDMEKLRSMAGEDTQRGKKDLREAPGNMHSVGIRCRHLLRRPGYTAETADYHLVKHCVSLPLC